MSENIRPVDKKALLRETGKAKTYVSPTTGRITNKPTADSVGIDRTTWWGANVRGGEVSSPIFSNPQARKSIELEVTEMAIYFPDFSLYSDCSTAFWSGKIDGLGEVRITYPQTYPAQKFLIELLDLDETFNEDLKQLVWSYDGITPAGAIIVAMRLFLRDKVATR